MKILMMLVLLAGLTFAFDMQKINYEIGLSYGDIRFEAEGQSELNIERNIGYKLGAYYNEDLLSFGMPKEVGFELGINIFNYSSSIPSQEMNYSLTYLATHSLIKLAYHEYNFGLGPFFEYAITGNQDMGAENLNPYEKDFLSKLNLGLEFRITYDIGGKVPYVHGVVLGYKYGVLDIEGVQNETQSTSLDSFYLSVVFNLN